MSWQPGGGVGVEEAEGAVVGGFDDCFPSCNGPVVGGRRVPCWVVGVEIAHHQGVATKVLSEEGGEVGRVTGWAAGCGAM